VPLPLNLPRLDAYLSTAGVLPPRKPVAVEEPSAYSQLTPAQQQEVDDTVAMQIRQQELADQPRGAFGEIGAGLVRGVTSELPRMIGGLLKAPSETGPLHDIGTNIQRFATRKGVEHAQDFNEGAHNAVTEAFASGASMVAPMFAGAAAIPVGAAVGLPALATTALAGGGLYAASTFQDTYEKAIKEGKTPEEARTIGYKTGAVEGLGETIGTYVGGKFVRGLSATPRVLGKKYGINEAKAEITKGAFLKTLAKNTAETAVVETGTEMAQNYGEAAIEKDAGIDTADPWKAATSAIGPTLALTALVGPLAALGTHSAVRNNQRALRTIDSPTTTFDEKDAAIRNLSPVMEQLVGKDAMRTWRMDTIVEASKAQESQRTQDQAEAQAQALDAQNAPVTDQRQPQVGAIPGIVPAAPKYASEADAQAVWDSFASTFGEQARAAVNANNAKQEEAVFRKLATSQLPEGVPTFAQFVAARKGVEGEPANAASVTARGLKLAYIQSINQAIRDRELTAQGEAQLSPERVPQDRLPLAPSGYSDKTPSGMREADASARLQAAAAEEPPAQGTAKALGLLPTSSIIKVNESGGTSYSGAKQERQKWLKQHVSNLPQKLRSELVDTEAPKLAEAVRQIWHDKGGERGPQYNIQLEALYASLTNGRNIRETFVAPEVQPVKESKNGISAESFKDPLDPQGQISTAVDEAQGNAQTQRQESLLKEVPNATRSGIEPGSSVTEHQGNGEGGAPAAASGGRVTEQGVPQGATQAQGQVTPLPAAPVAGATVLPPLAVKPVAGAAPAKKTQATVLKARGLALSVTPSRVTVTATGQSVPYGEFSNVAPEGTITYDIPKGVKGKNQRIWSMRSSTAKAAELARNEAQARGKNWGDIVPEADQRRVPEVQRYGFELYNYDENTGRAEGTNTLWATEYARALKNSTHQDAAGANATAALKWLDVYEGQDIVERAVIRNVAGIFKQNKLFKEMAEAHAEKIRKAIDEEVEQIVEERRQAIARGMSVPESDAQAREQLLQINKIIRQQDDQLRAANRALIRSRSRPTQEKARNAQAVTEFKQKFFDDLQDVIKGVVENDPRIMDLQTALPNYQHSPILEETIKSGKLDNVLAKLWTSGPSEWVRDLAMQLQNLGMKAPIEMVNMEAYNAKGERVYGRYDHATGTVRIYLGGANAHTVLHEVTHAGTVGKIRFAEEALRVSPGQRTSEQQSAVVALKALQSLKKEIEEMARGQFKQAFKNEKEFVAEVYANEEFQRWLSSQVRDGRTMMQRFRDWVRTLFGFKNIGADNMLKLAMNASAKFLGDSRFGAENGATFDHSLEGAMAATDRVGQWMTATWNKFAASHRTFGEIPTKLREAVLAVQSTFQISQMIDRSPQYRRLSNFMLKYDEAGSLKVIIQQGKHQEFSTVTTTVDYTLAKLSPPEQRAKEARLQELAGAQSVLDIDLNKGFDENAVKNKNLDPQYRDYVNRLHAEYMALDPRLRKAIEDSIRVYRKNYIQHTSTMVTRILRAYGAKTTDLYQKYIDRLDILDKNLYTEGPNTRPEYFFDAYAANLDARLRTVFSDFSKETKGEDTSSIREDMLEVEKFYNAAVSNPYQHLGRSGDHFISFSVAPGETAWNAVRQTLESHRKVIGTPGTRRHVFLRFENATQRNEAYKAVDALGAYIVRQDTPGDMKSALRSGTIFNESDITGMQGVPRFVQRLLNHVDSAFPGEGNAQMRQFLKRELMDAHPDTSAQKALMQRKDGGIAGYDANFSRSFAQRAEGMSSMLANAYTLPKYDQAFKMAREEIAAIQKEGNPQVADGATAIFSEMGQRFSNTLNPVDAPLIDRSRSLAHNFYLGLSPAFVLGNSVQPYHLSLPYLGGRYGFVVSAKEMGRSTKKSLKLIQNAAAAGIAAGKAAGGARGGLMGLLDLDLAAVFGQSGLTDGSVGQLNEIDGVKRLMASGQLDTTQTQEFARLTAGNSKGFSTAMKLLSTGSHYSEVNNRLTTFLAAYNLEMKHGRQNHDVAVDKGIKAVQATQLDYSNRNTARAFGRHGVAGKVTPLLTQFQQYSFQTMELIWRMAHDSLYAETAEEKAIAMKQLGGVLATTSVIAGTLGLPFASVIARVADGVLGSGDDPSDVKTAYRSWLAEVFGKDVAQLIAHGVPNATLGFDTSSRLGLHDLLPGTRFMTDRRLIKDMLEAGAFDMLGPAISAGQDVIAGVSKIYDGQVMDGLIQMTPLAIRGPMKSVKMMNVGYTTATGNQLPMEVTPWATLVQAGGFTPSVKAEQSEVNFAFRQMDGLLKQRKTVLSNELYRLAERGEDTTEALKRVMVFNETNPQYRIDIGAGMAARARARTVADTSGVDIATLPRYLPLLQRYNFANTK